MSNDRGERAARAEQMRKEREKADRTQRNLITVAIVVVVVAVIAVGGLAIKSAGGGNDSATKVIQPTNATKNYGVVYEATAAGGRTKPGVTPVKVELYEDFQCPICKLFEATDGPFLNNAVKTGQITIVYKPFSILDETGGSPNRYSHRSMNAALCVLADGGVPAYKKMHDLLYANQPQERTNGPANRVLIDWAKQVGVTGINSCVNAGKYTGWIDKAKSVGSDAGVSGTPTIRINGKDVQGAGGSVPQIADLQNAIAAAKAG